MDPDYKHMRQLVRAYWEAKAEFEAAEAVLNAHVANRTFPTLGEMHAEELARSKLVAARLALYAD